MERLTDPVKCRQVTDKYLRYFTFDVEDWFSKPENYALIEGENIAFGEYKSPGIYWVHFCYHTARGRQAIELTKDFLQEFYKEAPVKTSIGLIHKDNKKARWLIRQVGFTSIGMIDTKNGECEMFVLHNITKEIH